MGDKLISPTMSSKLILQDRIRNNLPVYNGGLGENPLPTPIFLKLSLQQNFEKKEYSNIEGDENLIQVLKSKYSLEHTIVGNGLKELIFNLIFSWENKVFVPTPCWVTYLEDLKILKKNYHTIEGKEINNYKLTPETLEESLKNNNGYGSLLILNNPTNPTGAIYSHEELTNLTKVFYKYDLTVFSDEIYFHTTKFKLISLSSLYNKVIIGSSLSKDWASGGWRFGWMVLSNNLKELHNKMVHNGSIIYSCPTQFFNNVAAEALSNKENNIHFESQSNFFYNIAEKIESELKDTKVIYSKYQGAWYKWLDLKNYNEILAKKNITNSTELVKKLAVEIGLIVVPGVCFGIEGLNFRLSMVSSNLDIGIKKLIQWLTE